MRLPSIPLAALVVFVVSFAAPTLVAAQEPTTTATTTTTTPATPPQAYSAPAAPVVAKDGGVTIADFQFAPSVVSIAVGDTVTWTNDGPSNHTASATGGEFDSGTLQPRQGFSHTFASPGTFSYVCSIHPEMRGTIEVSDPTGSDGGNQENTSPGSGVGGGDPTATTPTAGAGSESAATEATTAAGTAATLPATGQPALPLLLAGLALVGVGLRLRPRS
jgi:plastocyanin